jgi:hypothetical protein
LSFRRNLANRYAVLFGTSAFMYSVLVRQQCDRHTPNAATLPSPGFRRWMRLVMRCSECLRASGMARSRNPTAPSLISASSIEKD